MATAPAAAWKFIEVLQEIRIDARPERVWTCLTRDIGRWWPKDFHMLKNTRKFVLEAKVGGRVYEDCGKGEGLLWWTVTEIARPRVLRVQGGLSMRESAERFWVGHLFTEFGLEAASGGTLLRLREYGFGKVDEKLHEALDGGWAILLGKGLKPFAEKKKRS